MDTIDIIVGNSEFFLATEWNIILGMRQAEAALKDVAIQAAKDVGVEVDRSIPVEGYYGMELWRGESVNIEDLTEFFFAIKALQGGDPNKKVDSESLRRLDEFYHSQAFGLGPERPTPYHPNPPQGWEFKTTKPRYLSGVVDGVYLAMKKLGWNAAVHNTQETVQEVLLLQREGKLGVNLVALAALVDSLDNVHDGQIDPVFLTYAIFTTVLSRAMPRCGAAPVRYNYKWNVAPEVEKLGAAVIDAYNEAIARVLPDSGIQIEAYHAQDAKECQQAMKACDMFLGRDRIVRVDTDDRVGQLQWAVRYVPELQRHATFSLISRDVVNPVEYKNDPSIIDRHNPRAAVTVTTKVDRS